MFERPHELRELADWYRDFAQLAGEQDHDWHMDLVDFLEGRAEEIEESRDARPVTAPDYCYPLGMINSANN